MGRKKTMRWASFRANVRFVQVSKRNIYPQGIFGLGSGLMPRKHSFKLQEPPLRISPAAMAWRCWLSSTLAQTRISGRSAIAARTEGRPIVAPVVSRRAAHLAIAFGSIGGTSTKSSGWAIARAKAAPCTPQTPPSRKPGEAWSRSIAWQGVVGKRLTYR
jgi:hypothetical protein